MTFNKIAIGLLLCYIEDIEDILVWYHTIVRVFIQNHPGLRFDKGIETVREKPVVSGTSTLTGQSLLGHNAKWTAKYLVLGIGYHLCLT